MASIHINTARSIVNPSVTIFWMRRDLRISDNAALYHALKANRNVLPLFIFDTNILDTLEDKQDQRVAFIHDALKKLHDELHEIKSSLLILSGNPVEIFSQLSPGQVYANHDYESYAISRDDEVREILRKKNIPFHTFKDHVIFEKDEIIKIDGTPYTVFTPYSKQWKSRLNNFFIKPYPGKKYFGRLFSTKPLPVPTLEEIGFKSSDTYFPERKIRTAIIQHYHQTRDFPAVSGTSLLSVHLRFGTVSIRKLVALARKQNETWLNELIWREFYAMILWHFPHVEYRAFKPAFDHLVWRNNEEEFKQWCEGRTGYPLVDAGMRELNATGFMHNRVRMVVASFLTKHLLIDWRWGEAYFAKKLLDYDLASNNGGWQWAAGSGCDAAPYFRIFNPHLQAKKFDPDLIYIKKWVPEYNEKTYPKEIVDHAFARERALRTYKKGLA